jgi:hypothetical protein
MRVTRELLLNLAQEQANKMAAKDPSIQCIYLVGSLLGETAFLGGVTDIDLVLVHDHPVPQPREIVRINSEVHLDIAHLQDTVYDPPRRLREDAWIGGSLDVGPRMLFERYHWFDFVRASACAQYWQSEHRMARARGFAAASRRAWQTLVDENPQGLKRTQLYLDALRDCADSLVVLDGLPLSPRRFMLDLPERMREQDLSDFTGLFVAQFANDSVSEEQLEKWHGQWLESYDALKGSKDAPVKYCSTRRNYYEKAIEVLATDHPAAALWLLLTTWTEIAAFLPKSAPEYKNWQSFLRALDLDSKNMPERIESLDSLLDRVETTLDQVAAESV